MRILCILSWRPGSRWLWDYLPESGHQVDFAYVHSPPDRFPGYGKLINYYPKFWELGLRTFPHLERYDVVVTWEANTALPLAFLRSLTGRRSPPLVVLNFVLKGKPVLDFLWTVRFAMHSVDHITCLSQGEIDVYTKVLDYPKSRCTKLQGPFRDHFAGRLGQAHQGDYIFAAGRSHRDYRTLIEAVRDLPVKVIINARSFNVKGLKPPANVTINPYLPFDEFLFILESARLIVLPLLPARHASGETFLMQAMSAQKAAIVSQTLSMSEIIEPGVNGILVPPGDPPALRNAIQQLLDDPTLVEQLGKTARQHYLERWSFPVAALQIDGLLHQIVGVKN